MKTGEWIIKLLSYIICLSAVCAGFAFKEKQADEALAAYIKRGEEERTERLCALLLRLKDGIRESAAKKSAASAYEVSYCCKAAADLVSECEPGKESETLRAFLIRIKNVCDTAGEDKADNAAYFSAASTLYTRLTALESVLREGRTSADALIKELSYGLPENKDGKAALKVQISKSRAERCAKNELKGARITKCEKYNGGFIFSSSGSFAVIDGEGKTAAKSKTTTDGREKYGINTASDKAKEHISDITGLPSEAEYICDAFGILYFRVVCDGKEYPVGIDKTDGSVVFEIISEAG